MPATFTPWRILFLLLVGPVVFIGVVLAFHLESPEIPHNHWTDDGAMVVDFDESMWIDRYTGLGAISVGVQGLGC